VIEHKWSRSDKSNVFWIMVLLLMAIAVTVVGCQSTQTEADGEADQAEAVGGEVRDQDAAMVGFTEDGHVYRGNPNASVVIEEFSSYQCPFCGRYFDETYADLMNQYVDRGKVQYIFRDFPLAGQPQSPLAAEAARCAADVGGAQSFWDMHDRIFSGRGDWSGNSEADQVFKGYAGDLGLDSAAFDECLDSGRMSASVQADWTEGRTRGVTGTPSFFINGQLLVGAQPISAFATAIDRALAGEAAVSSGDTGPSATDVRAPDVVIPTPAVFEFETGAAEEVRLSLGDPNAPVTIVEFTDYQCPVCATHFEQTWPTLKEEYIDTGRVFWVLKDFPLTSIHPQAFAAHKAARCVLELGDADAYWEMHDLLFQNQQAWSGSEEHLTLFSEYASQLGLDSGAFTACVASASVTDAVQADVDEGLAYGVNGTPTFFIGGYPFSGAHPIQNFDQIITLAENGQLRNAIAEAIAAAEAQQQAQNQPRPTMAPADVPLGDAPILGDPDAPITIVEYSDYQCPFCSRHYSQTYPLLQRNFIETGIVRYVFKDFPLTSIHPQAVEAAEAARCAREVGGDSAYWEMHDRLFDGQDAWSGNPEYLAVFEGYAAELELDQTAFRECLDSGRYVNAITADLEEGAGFGVSGTPAFFVNGQPLQGAQPYEAFVALIEALSATE
jgi:protein-disulfide isomerase